MPDDEREPAEGPQDKDDPERGEVPDRKGEDREEDDYDKHDLEERTARFGEAIIAYAKKIPRSPVNVRLIEQLVDAGTSVGANYNEADDAESKKDFRHKIAICKKEARESKFWLRMSATAEPSLKDEARVLWQEAKEFHLIVGRIKKTCDGR